MKSIRKKTGIRIITNKEMKRVIKKINLVNDLKIEIKIITIKVMSSMLKKCYTESIFLEFVHDFIETSPLLDEQIQDKFIIRTFSEIF